MTILLNAEFGNLWAPDGTPIQETVEVTANRYSAFCSDEPWSASCFNNFWAYAQPITDMEVHANDRNNARWNARYNNDDFFESLMTTANDILSGNVQGSKAPWHYGNARVDMPAFLNGEREAYWMYT